MQSQLVFDVLTDLVCVVQWPRVVKVLGSYASLHRYRTLSPDFSQFVRAVANDI